MALLIQCPNATCKTSCSVDEAANGRTVACPKCKQAFVATPTMDGPKGDTKKSQPSTSANPFPVLPATFGRYRILQLLGQGGMGAVYLAQDSQLGRQVALKVPFFEPSESPQRLERFVREARSAAALHHPNICTVFDAGQIDGRPFITMAYIAGTPLDREIDADVPMTQVRAAEIVRRIALALEHAHRKGIVHRDLKPANVMMMEGSGDPVVMDFGLAKQVVAGDSNEPKLTRLGGILGTPSYMAPEQVEGDSAAIGPATDVYALGVILFEMLTGNTPYCGSLTAMMGQILAAPVPLVKEFRPEVDLQLDAICRKAMAKKPADRFPSMAELANALSKYLATPPASPPPLVDQATTEVFIVPSPIVAAIPVDTVMEVPAAKPVLKKTKWQGVMAAGLALSLLAVGLLTPLGCGFAWLVFRGDTKDNKKQTGKGDKGKLPENHDAPHDDVNNTIGMKLVWIKPGSFLMGSPDGKNPPDVPAELGRNENEGPQHRVTLTKGYLIGATHVTQYQWEQVLGPTANHSTFKGGDEAQKKKSPVDNVSWFDSVEFCNKLSDKEGRKPCYRLTDVKREREGDSILSANVERLRDGTGYRLPTEAEWEYAYRAGTEGAYYFGKDFKTLGEYFRSGVDNTNAPSFVGERKPNPWGLYDMGGNLHTWCEDWFGPYGPEDKTDPLVLDKDDKPWRVLRGGSLWHLSNQYTCRAAYRSYGPPADRNSVYGCRIVLCQE